MQVRYYPGFEAVKEVMVQDEPLLVMVSFNGEEILVSPIDEAVEHHILLKKLNINPVKIDKYFRLVVNKEGADWTFVCPSDYKNIPDKRKRIMHFYNDGFRIISQGLSEIGYAVGINIPRRYRRHLDELKDEN